jgi:hypothetical protein
MRRSLRHNVTERQWESVNIEQLQKQLYKHLKLRPFAHQRRAVGDFIEIDWLWQLHAINKKDGEIDLRSGAYCLKLKSDHIRNYMSNINNDFDGFLNLRVLVIIEGNNITIEPLSSE